MTENSGSDAAKNAAPHGAPMPLIANTGATLAIGLELQENTVVPRRQVRSWALWDWATQPFNSVILTFIFTALYLTTDVFLPSDIAALPDDDPAKVAGLAELASGFGLAIFLAGLVILVLAPVLGQRADRAGNRKAGLLVYTVLLVLCMAGLFFVQGQPSYFVLGASLVAIGSVFSELAGVNYNAMLVQISTKKTIGRVSGLGWGLGYIGGIVALVIVLVAYIFDWFGLPQDDGLPFRVVAAGCAVWTVIFAIPIFVFVPEAPRRRVEKTSVNFFASYAVLARDIVALFRESRHTFWFLMASAVYRDGLAGVFAFGAIIASGTFGFKFLEVAIFGIAANLVAGVSTIVSGHFDDRFGPRAVIVFSLVGLVVAGTTVFALHDGGKIVFWIGGLALCLFVGPAQTASRSLLARVSPAGSEGEIFGLYATTGRAASFISPGLWSLFIAIAGAQYWGILGIVLVVAVGLVLMLMVRLPKLRETPAGAA
jgi:UMF1 family MFS transporter